MRSIEAFSKCSKLMKDVLNWEINILGPISTTVLNKARLWAQIAVSIYDIGLSQKINFTKRPIKSVLINVKNLPL